jgi:transcriptional regulator with XRE-family HTH domain
MQREVGHRVQTLRKRCGMSIRQTAERARVTAGMISCIERGKTSPSITTLQKILTALGTDLAAFFAGHAEGEPGPVFPREAMRTISDGERNYTIVFAKRDEIHVEMFDEHIYPGRRRPPFETLQCDVAGYIIGGRLVLEIRGRDRQTLRPGDAFYIPKGQEHRGWAAKDQPVRLITVYHPAKY